MLSLVVGVVTMHSTVACHAAGDEGVRSMYRKSVLGVLATAAGLTILAGCSDGGSASGAPSTAAPTSSAAPATSVSSSAAHNGPTPPSSRA